MKIVGLNATKNHIYVISAADSVSNFVVEDPQRIDFKVEPPEELGRLLEGMIAVLQARLPSSDTATVAVLSCQAGPHGSSREAIKAEGVCELAAIRCGFQVVRVSAQGLKTPLGCEGRASWRDRAKLLLNPRGEVPYWAEGMNGAAAAAYRAAWQT